jgi:hypothetical protein
LLRFARNDEPRHFGMAVWKLNRNCEEVQVFSYPPLEGQGNRIWI